MEYQHLAKTNYPPGQSNFDKLTEDVFCNTCGEIYQQSPNGQKLTCVRCNINRNISQNTVKPNGYSSSLELKNTPEPHSKQLLNFNDIGLLHDTTLICPDCKNRSIKTYCIPSASKKSIGYNLIVCINCLTRVLKPNPSLSSRGESDVSRKNDTQN